MSLIITAEFHIAGRPTNKDALLGGQLITARGLVVKGDLVGVHHEQGTVWRVLSFNRVNDTMRVQRVCSPFQPGTWAETWDLSRTTATIWKVEIGTVYEPVRHTKF